MNPRKLKVFLFKKTNKIMPRRRFRLAFTSKNYFISFFSEYSAVDYTLTVLPGQDRFILHLEQADFLPIPAL